jgi:uroporphyrinogen decarboxylase
MIDTKSPDQWPDLPYGEMKPRERVMAALAHEETDRVPADLWGVPEVWQRLTQHFGMSQLEILRTLRIDMRWVAPKYVGPVRELPGGVRQEGYGHLRREQVHDFGSYSEYAGYPLDFAKTAQDVYDWDWAKTEYWDPSNLPGELAALDDEDDYFICYDLGGIFERAWGLLGFERFLADLAESPEVPMAIMECMTDLYIANFKRVVEAANGRIDMVYTWDDIAHQRGLLMSPRMWRKFILPHHQRLNEVIHSYPIKHMYHSCGAVFSIMGDLITELGIDILNPLQPAAAGMDMVKIKEQYGSRVTFHGGVDIQNTLPNGTPEEVSAEVRSRCQVLGTGGGYILAPSHYIQNDTPTPNILAMYRTPRETHAD